MAIRLEDLFEQKADAYPTSVGNQRFASDFLSGIRKAIGRINVMCNQSYTMPTSIEDTVNIGSDNLEFVLYDMVDYYLYLQGHYMSTDPQAISLADIRRRHDEAIASVVKYITDQYSNSDEDDVAVLGYTG